MANGRQRSRNAINLFADAIMRAEDTSNIEGFLSFVARPPLYARFRQYIIFHKGDLSNELGSKFSYWSPQLEPINPNAGSFRLNIKYGKNNEKKAEGAFAVLPSSQNNIHRIVTISYTAFWNSGIRKVVKRAYPQATPIFFKQDEIQDALLNLESSLDSNHRIHVADVTMKGKRTDLSHPYRGRFDTERLWTDLAIKDVFNEAKERRHWFTSLKFVIQRKKPKTDRFTKIASGRIYKYGQINYDFLHREISDSLITTLENHAASRLLLLDGRGIKERNYQPQPPLEIVYGSSIFNKAEEVRRFGQVISKYPNATKAVFHANPYYHASVADFLDGSSFEIWVLSPRRVVVVPQAKSSEQALERLISHIFFEFQEGEIGEYSEESTNFDHTRYSN